MRFHEMMRTGLSLTAVVFAMMLTVPALAQDDVAKDASAAKDAEEAVEEANGEEAPFERHVWRWQSASYLRYNSLGLANASQLGYRYMLFDSDSPLMKDTYLSLSLAPTLTPSYIAAGPQLEFKPLAVVVLSAKFDYLYNFGTFGNVYSLPTPNAPHSDTVQDKVEEDKLNYSTTGTLLTLGALLQAKVGNIAARSQAKWMRYDVEINEGDTVFYDVMLDTLVPDQGWAFTLDSDLLYTTDTLTIGIRHAMTSVTYEDSDFLPGESTENPNTPIHRLGPLIAYKLSSNPNSAVNSQTVFTLINWYLEHRHRAGDDSSQAMPYIVVGYAVSGIL